MLTQEDFKSPTWQRVSDHLETNLAMARQQNDKNLNAEETANMRAKLADSAMKERSKQQLLAAELVHANQYGQGV